MKPFDEHFADNVRETFDNWREQVPDGAWASMEATLDGARQPKVVPFWSNRAKVAVASILVAASVALLVVPVFLLTRKADPLKTSTVAEVSESQAVLPDPSEPQSTPSIQKTLAPTLKSSIGAERKKKPTLVQPGPVIAVLQTEHPKGSTQLAETTDLFVNDQKKLAQTPEKSNAADPQLPQKEKEIDQVEPSVRETKISDESDYLLWLPASTPKSRLSWSVSASPMLSFAENQPTPLPGLSAGISAGYNLTDRVRVEVGGLLAYTQLDVRNQATRALEESFANLHGTQSGAVPEPNFSGNNKYSFLALEIPANIQFSVFEGSGSMIFVSTGLSSMVYLHQTVSGVNHIHFQNAASGLPLGSESYFSTTIFIDDSFGPLSRIDLGRILNLSAGLVIVGKKNSIILEPFLKLPLGDISSSNLNLGKGGMSLKFLFSGK